MKRVQKRAGGGGGEEEEEQRKEGREGGVGEEREGSI